MEKLTINKTKDELLKILCCIDEICKKHNINYSLAYGTMLGAVRHNGFIPWDDDLDILMTRENYDKFLSLEKTEFGNLKILTNKDKNYNLLFAKVINPKIKIVSDHKDRYDDDQSLFIDIFPMDYLSDDYDKGVKRIKKDNFKLCLLIAAQWKNYYENKIYGKLRQIPRFIFFIMSRFVNSKKLVKKLEKNINHIKKKYMYCIALNRAKIEIFESKIYDEYIKIEFEGKQFSCIKDYDVCLKTIYGDYMTPPPEDKRIFKHSFSAYYRN